MKIDAELRLMKFETISRLRREAGLEEEAVIRERRKMETDLFYLGTKVFNNDRLGRIHQELSDTIAAKDWDKLMVLIPRDHLKSTFITEYFTIQTLLANPDARIMIGSSTIAKSKSFLRVIKGWLKSPEIFQYYGELEGDVWSSIEISLKTKGNRNIKENSVVASGLDQSTTSQHFDLIILDDIVDKTNITSPEMIEKTRAYYGECLNLLDKKTGKIILIGTRKHADDLYGYVLKNLSNQFKTIIRKYEENGTYIYAPYFNPNVIARLRESMTPNEFSMEYCNDPLAGAGREFHEEYFKHYGALYEDDIYNCFITIDPAVAQRSGSDYTAIVVSLVNSISNVYVNEVIKEKFSPAELIDTVMATRDRYSKLSFVKYVGVGCETTGFQLYIKHSLEEEMKKKNDYFPIEELSHKSRNKFDRIRGLEPYYRGGKIYHREFACARLEEELLWFGNIHPDVADSLAYQINMWFAPKVEKKPDKTNPFAKMYEDILNKSTRSNLTWYNNPRGHKGVA